MLYIRLCIDKPGTTELRESVRAEHRAYFKPNLSEDAALRLVQAGPLCVSDNDDTNLASFMVIEAASIEEVEAFHQATRSRWPVSTTRSSFTAGTVISDVKHV